MFSLEPGYLQARILDCGGGPSSFAAEVAEQRGRVVAIDPLYADPVQELRERIDASFDQVVELARRNAHRFVWGDRIGSPQALAKLRRAAMDRFLDDFEREGEGGRYLQGALPRLPFADDAFDLALCSHLLFLYGEQFDLRFHVESLVELARVAREVRVFPLLDMEGEPSRHLRGAREGAGSAGLTAEEVVVPYEFQRGGNQMLVVARRDGGINQGDTASQPGATTL